MGGLFPGLEGSSWHGRAFRTSNTPFRFRDCLRTPWADFPGLRTFSRGRILIIPSMMLLERVSHIWNACTVSTWAGFRSWMQLEEQ